MVIENHPRLEDGSPFPTTFWLTCPLLLRRVAAIEGDGRMAAFNEQLTRDEALRARLEKAMNVYVEYRDSLEVIDGAAPGGGPERVKCLHAHVAHELVGSANPAGAWALATAGYPDCRQACYEVTTR